MLWTSCSICSSSEVMDPDSCGVSAFFLRPTPPISLPLLLCHPSIPISALCLPQMNSNQNSRIPVKFRPRIWENFNKRQTGLPQNSDRIQSKLRQDSARIQPGFALFCRVYGLFLHQCTVVRSLVFIGCLSP